MPLRCQILFKVIIKVERKGIVIEKLTTHGLIVYQDRTVLHVVLERSASKPGIFPLERLNKLSSRINKTSIFVLKDKRNERWICRSGILKKEFHVRSKGSLHGI